jgi:hypothetical protein
MGALHCQSKSVKIIAVKNAVRLKKKRVFWQKKYFKIYVFQLSYENPDCSFVFNHLFRQDILLEWQVNKQTKQVNIEVIVRKKKYTTAFK